MIAWQISVGNRGHFCWIAAGPPGDWQLIAASVTGTEASAELLETKCLPIAGSSELRLLFLPPNVRLDKLPFLLELRVIGMSKLDQALGAFSSGASLSDCYLHKRNRGTKQGNILRMVFKPPSSSPKWVTGYEIGHVWLVYHAATLRN